MLKRSIIQGLAEGASESLTKFLLEKSRSDSKKSESSMVEVIQNYLKNRRIKHEKLNQIIQQFLISSREESEELQQRLEQAKQNHKKRGEIR